MQGRALTGAQDAEQARRSDHRPSRRAPHAARNPRLQRGGARAPCCGRLCRATRRAVRRTPRRARRADDRLGLLTPVLKGVLTDIGFANAVKAQQVFGGHGYIAEWGMEQFVRDARIAMIYEGANGIQALDLVGRKLPKDGGRAVTAFFGEISAFLAANKDDEALAPYLGGLKTASGQLQQATMWLMQNAMGNPDNAGAGSTDYMHLFGLTLLGYMWARIAKAVLAKKAKGETNEALETKLVLAKFFNERMMPEAGAHLARAERRAPARSWRCRRQAVLNRKGVVTDRRLLARTRAKGGPCQPNVPIRPSPAAASAAPCAID